MKKYNKKNRGFSLIEILVVITIFSIIGILTTRSIFLTIRGSKKSDSLVRIRENVNFSLGVVERQIRNSESVECPNADPNILNYVSLEGKTTSFACNNSEGYIASGSARLTSADVLVTQCSFVCTREDLNVPPSIKITIVAEDANSTAAEKGSITTETEIIARNF